MYFANRLITMGICYYWWKLIKFEYNTKKILEISKDLYINKTNIFSEEEFEIFKIKYISHEKSKFRKKIFPKWMNEFKLIKN